MKVKVRKKSAPAVECGKRTNKTVSAPFLIGDICDYRRRENITIPYAVTNQENVDLNEVLRLIRSSNFSPVSPKARNMRLSELAYILNQTNAHNHHV